MCMAGGGGGGVSKISVSRKEGRGTLVSNLISYLIQFPIDSPMGLRPLVSASRELERKQITDKERRD